MSLLIGIIMRDSISQMGHNIGIVYNDMVLAVRKSGGIPIMIFSDNINDYLNICSGFIFQGGDDISENNLKILEILRNRNIPVLGICLGMQEIGVLYGGMLKKIENHSGNEMHEVKIMEDSLLHKILGVNKIMVNSRHKFALVVPNINVCASSNDGVIEAICDEKLKFFLGLEWHPENMYEEDVNAKKIFDYFIKICNDN